MIVHRTTYGFYTSIGDRVNIMTDCKRSIGNRRKIYHSIDLNGNIALSSYYDGRTGQLLSTPTTLDMELKSVWQREWIAEKNKIRKDPDPDKEQRIDDLFKSMRTRP